MVLMFGSAMIAVSLEWTNMEVSFKFSIWGCTPLTFNLHWVNLNRHSWGLLGPQRDLSIIFRVLAFFPMEKGVETL